ncbi:MAG: hypothetical protein KDB14_21620 [Planctomycetales bacterium]|nr:hypothetical protein [Planctomycetales bacterium]
MAVVLLMILLLWGLPMLTAFWLGRITAAPVSGPVNASAVALRELDQLHLHEQLDARAYLLVRTALVRKCERAGTLAPAMSVTDVAEKEKAERIATLDSPSFAATMRGDVLGAEALEHPAASSFPLSTHQAVDAEVSAITYVDAAPGQQESGPFRSLPPLREEASPLDEPTPQQPALPRRSWGELLHGFMEERNIRWGELLSGMLILGSSTGLVLSLREQLQATIPYFPSFMFLMLIGMVHAAGGYTIRRWKLETTSRGVLVIGMLLVPLGLLASCLLSARGEVRAISDPMYLLAVATGIAGYGVMAYGSSRVLLPRQSVSLAVSVLGASIWMLVVHRAGRPEADLGNLLLGAIPPLLAMAPALLFARAHARPWSDGRSEQFALAAGLPTFAAGVSLAYLLYRVDSLTTGPAPALICFAASLLSVSGLLWQQRSRRVAWQVAGGAVTIVALAGAVVGMVFSWPEPRWIVTAGTMGWLVLFGFGLAMHSPLLVGGSLVTLTPAWLVGTQWAFGYIDADTDLLVAGGRSLVSSLSALAMNVLLLALAGAAAWQRRMGQRQVATVLGVGAVVMAACSVTLALAAGATGEINDVRIGVGLLTTYGVAALLGAAWTPSRQQPVATLAGAGLLLAGCLLGALGTHPLWVLPLVPNRVVGGLLPFSWAMVVVAASLRHLVRNMGPKSLGDGESNAGTEEGHNVDARGWTAGLACCGAVVAVLAVYFPFPPPLSQQWAAWVSAALVSFVATYSQLGWPGGTSAARRHEIEFFSLQTQALSFMAIGVGVAAAVTHQTDIARLGDGRLYHALALALALAAGLISELLRRVSVSPLCQPYLQGAKLAERSLVAPMMAFLVMATGWHVLLVGQAAWLGQWRHAAPEPAYLANAPWLALSALATISAVIALRTWQTPSTFSFEGLALLGVLMATRMSVEAAQPVTATCWTLAAWSVMLTGMMFQRSTMHAAWQRWGGRLLVRSSPPLAHSFAATAFVPAVAIVLALTGVSLFPESVGGLKHDLVSTWRGMLATLVAPIAIQCAMLLAIARALKLEAPALAGGLIGTAVVAMAALFGVRQSGAEHDFAAILLQSELLWAGAWAWAWRLATRESIAQSSAQSSASAETPSLPDNAWVSWRAWTLLLPLVLSTWVLGAVVVNPTGDNRLAPLANWPSWIGVLAAGALAAAELGRKRRVGMLAAGLGVALVALLVASLDAADANRQWWAYHGLLSGMAALAGSLAAAAYRDRDRDREQVQLQRQENRESLASAALACCAVAYAMVWRALPADPMAEEWGQWICLALAAIAAWIGVLHRNRWAIPASLGLGVTAAWLLSLDHPMVSQRLFVPWSAALLIGGGWALTHVFSQRDGWPRPLGRDPLAAVRGTSLHLLVSWLGAGLALALSLLLLLAPPARVEAWGPAMMTLSCQFALALVCLADQRVSRRGETVFVSGLALTMAVAAGVLMQPMSHWIVGPLAVSCYLAGAGWLWRQRGWTDSLLTRVGCPPQPAAPSALRWLAPAVAGIGVVTVLAAAAVAPSVAPVWQRGCAAAIPLLVAVAMGLLSSDAPVGKAAIRGDAVGAPFHRQSLALGVLGIVWLSWTIPVDPTLDRLLTRLGRSLLTVALVGGALGVIATLARGDAGRNVNRDADQRRWPRLSESWRTACADLFTGCLAVTGLLFVTLLGAEWRLFDRVHGAPIGVFQSGAVIVVIGLLIASLIVAAVSPRRDPLRLSESMRASYTYVAQALAALVVLQVYLSMPWLFSPAWTPYWPYMLMLIAFAGAGAGESLQRSGIPVLGDPLVRTSLLLPLVPLLGMLGVQSASNYPTVCALSSLLFALAALLGRSWIFGVAAVSLGNATLWSFYRHMHWLSFAQNPQAWLIPPAISVLAAAQFYRNRLGAAQLAALRYIAIGVIYVSSCSELFIHGISETLWPPMVLATLSVAGVFAGIAMRIRAFLYFGTSFLFMSLVAMVSHAGRAFGHVWPWWVFGLTMGIGILVMFGLFEKRRDEVRQVVSQLRSWDP